ncbi:MAG: phenylalanine--tRNA ligase subunit beta [Chloroflexi bacterium HGW-Chloroflexi-3]|nr:MAG: phenylalanine--tRNA ligase subunit beta [Chloroflexi bacterium HGW-Chloroflexi-3]
MKIPLSWLKDYIDLDLSLEELARTLTMVGLEVEVINVIGLPLPENTGRQEFKFTGLAWNPEKFIVAQIDEVMPHPDADRLTLCRLHDGIQEWVVLTGAPNLFPYKGMGTLEQPLKVAYAREDAILYDGHKPGYELTKLKRTKIRGVESFSMVCSEKELGISDEHEGVIILDSDAPTGTPLVDYMGDAVIEVAILPNMIRDASMVGVARELSAVTGKPLKVPSRKVTSTGPKIDDLAAIEINDPNLNPRFVLGLVQGLSPKPSPYWVQRRLRLAGMRPINSIVDATNYVMLETGEPLHAFDYDVLIQRAGGKAPTIITRAVTKGENLTTLDDVERPLDQHTILVCDTAGPLSLAGIMGGLESEVTETTRNVLLEGASWNFINVRRTSSRLHLNSEAGYRFGRGVHPALASWAVDLGLERMAAWSGGTIAQGLVDNYPQPPLDPLVSISVQDVERKLGVTIPAKQIAVILTRLEFVCKVSGDVIEAQTPPHRLDIGEGVIGKADLMEEIARIYSYNNIPETNLADELPPQRNNLELANEEKIKDILAGLGLQEVITYRLTSIERETRAYLLGQTPDPENYVRLLNPIAPERSVMRQSLLASVLEVLEKNARIRERLAFFEIGSLFIQEEENNLPVEPRKLVIGMSGKRNIPIWNQKDTGNLDFYDLKGVLEELLEKLHLEAVAYQPTEHPSMHPGKTAQILVGQTPIGVLGELHPRVKQNYDFLTPAVYVAEIDLEALLPLIPLRFESQPVSVFPPVLEDIAIIVEEAVPADRVEALIRQTGGKLLADVRLFDVYRGDRIGAGKKSLAYSMTYQALDHTIESGESTALRNKIVRRLERELGAVLRDN